MNTELRLALIGCGQMGRVHATNIGQLANAKVVAWCDAVKEKAERFLGEFGGLYATDDPTRVINDDGVDGVLIATAGPGGPGYLHAELGAAAARSGKHVFVEKPIASSPQKADELVAAIDETGVKFQLGFCFQYSPTVARAKQLMPAPAYSVCQCAASVSAQASHNLDLILHKFHDAPLKSVYAGGGKFFAFDRYLPIDSFAAVLTFADGSVSSYVQHGALNPKLNKFQFQLFGPQGCVFLADRFREVLWYPEEGQPAEPYREETLYMGHLQEVQDFVRCILENRQPINTAERGRHALMVEAAILQSATTGKVVRM